MSAVLLKRADQLERLEALMREEPNERRYHGPSAVQLGATRMRRSLAATQAKQAFDPQAVVGWRTFLVPTEVFYATGALPFTPESMCAVLSRNQELVETTIEQAEQSGYNLKQCSFLKTVIGGARNGLLPAPDIVVGSSCFCSGIGSILHDAAKHFECPFFYLDLPIHADVDRVAEHVASQLRELSHTLCGITGLNVNQMEQVRLPLAIERANEASKYWKDVEQLRKSVPSPMSGREALDFATVLSQHWGSEEIIDVYRSLRDELQDRVDNHVPAVPNEAVRVFWLHLRPYYSNAMMHWVEEAGGAVVFEEVNYPARLPMDANDPYLSLAREILLNSGRYRIFTEDWEDDIRYVVRDFHVDGVIHFAHDNCSWSELVFPPMYRFIRDELRLPIVSIDGDCLIKGRDNLMKTRVQAFIESLISRRARNVSGPQMAEQRGRKQPRAERDHFVGIDVGSATTKAVILDSELTIQGFSVLPTGSHNRKTVEAAFSIACEGLDGLRPEAARAIVSTGIGRENVPFEHDEVTELTCQTRGVLYLDPQARTIIDIGGQDTKAILVEQSIIRLNTSCAAGTGRFLEVIANAMGLDISEMIALDMSAEKAAPISKMCTVFAESEVVNRIASGADVAEIARGVHQMVASKAATLVRQLSPKIDPPIVVTGGVAQNVAVVGALQQNLHSEIRVPRTPQITGALGAAIIAAERALAHSQRRLRWCRATPEEAGS